MATIILVDDHALFRLGARVAVESLPEKYQIIGEASRAEELWPLLKERVPDVLLLDIILPDMDGVAIATRVKAEYPQMRILILSAETSETVILNLLKAGVDGFISKEILNTGLQVALRTVLMGDQYYGNDIATILNHMIFHQGSSPTANGQTLFTDREQAVIELCCQGLPTKIISDQLGISSRTVETHKANIFTKLGVTNLAELVRYCFKHGIVQL